VKELNIPFYLTGGTALSRHYFHHRFSDDLDLFVNSDASYNHYIDLLFQAFETRQKSGQFAIDYERLRKEENYTQFFLIGHATSHDKQAKLKIDLVNDIASHYGDFEYDETLGTIDGWRNILSNKLSSIFRYEAKDFVDIWIISKKRAFLWKEIVREAKTKEAGTDPIVIYEILKSFPSDVLPSIKWNRRVDEKEFINDLNIIAEDIFKGNKNTLFTQ
jgi:predicted nucleotidyltransferase component of viral defense system